MIKELLNDFESASGQAINYQKLTLYFSPNVNEGLRASIKSILGIHVVFRLSRYLGLLSTISYNHLDIFSPIVKRIGQQVAGWKEKLFSFAGKEVLIKSVAQAIPTYTLSLFQLLEVTIRDIHWLFSKFWWGFIRENDKMHWYKAGASLCFIV